MQTDCSTKKRLLHSWLIVFNVLQYSAIVIYGIDLFILLVALGIILVACCGATRLLLVKIVPDPQPWIIKAVALVPVSTVGVFFLDCMVLQGRVIGSASLLLGAVFWLIPFVAFLAPFALMVVVATFQKRQRESEPGSSCAIPIGN